MSLWFIQNISSWNLEFEQNFSSDLSRKKKLRGAHRASATQLQKTVSEVLVSFDPNNLEEIAPKLNQLKTSMKEKLETLKVLDEEILELS